MTQIDLSKYPAPDVLEAIDYETILGEIQTHFVGQFPVDEITAAEKGVPTQAKVELLLAIEGNLIVKQLEAYAYHAAGMRARVNDAAKATMLAYATGADLENLGAFYAVQRKDGENDTDLRARIVIAIDGLSTAGPIGAYKFHGLSADPDVKDIAVDSPEPGQVRITVLSHSGNGIAPQQVIDAVLAALNDEDVRPLTDHVIVQAAAVADYTIDADIWCFSGVDSGAVRQAAEDAAAQYASDIHQLGYDVTDSGLKSALHQPGVQRVELITPSATIVNDATEASFCTGVTVTYRGNDV
jgi:phage-related baseplate assembly protein